jgi:hypothetical protein
MRLEFISLHFEQVRVSMSMLTLMASLPTDGVFPPGF